MLPGFVCIGAQRAGTTWLHNCLSEHPEVFMPKEKESHYFDSSFDRGLQWYEGLFEGSEGFKAVGEISPNYLNVEESAQRIHEVIPEVRILCILREPVSRAFSAYCLFKEKDYPGMSFRQALEADDYLIDLGRYNTHLSRYFELFPKDHLRVLTYDYVCDDPESFLRELFTYIGVDPNFHPPSAHKRYNRVIYGRVQAQIRNMGFGWAMELVKTTKLGDWIRNRQAGASGGDDDPIGIEDRAFLQEAYRYEMQALKDLTGIDTSIWF